MRDILDHILSRIQGEKIDPDPFPHFFVDRVFPDDFYAALLQNLPKPQQFIPVDYFGAPTEEENSDRSVIDLNADQLAPLAAKQKKFWGDLAAALESQEFTSAIAQFAYAHLKERFFGQADLPVHAATNLTRIKKGYSLGPHTDSAHKLITIIFYLAPDRSKEALGTSVYMPKDRTFKCAGGPHHEFSDFELIKTAPYLPNSLFGFVKSDASFHGVEELIEPGITRDTLLYNLTLG